MRVDVYSRKQAEDLTPEVNQAIISITVPGKPAAIRLVHDWAGILRLEFHDITMPENGLVPFDEAMADRLRAFIDEHAQEIDCPTCRGGHFAKLTGRECQRCKGSNKIRPTDFVVHCDAGVSRSVAVGVYIRDVYGAELVTHATPTAFGANNLILRTLMRKHWEERLR